MPLACCTCDTYKGQLSKQVQLLCKLCIVEEVLQNVKLSFSLYRFTERDAVSQELHEKLQTAQTDLRTAHHQVMYTWTTCIQVATACKYASAAVPAVHVVSVLHTRHIAHPSGCC
jgi:hypothetical protein